MGQSSRSGLVGLAVDSAAPVHSIQPDRKSISAFEFLEISDDNTSSGGPIPYDCVIDYIYQTGVFSPTFPETISEGSSIFEGIQEKSTVKANKSLSAQNDVKISDEKGPKLRLIIENADLNSVSSLSHLRKNESNALVKGWNLPLEFVEVLHIREIHTDFTWNRLVSVATTQLFKQIICYEDGTLLVLSSDLKAKSTCGILLSRNNEIRMKVLETLNQNPQLLRHPLCIPLQLLEYKLALEASSTNYTFKLLDSAIYHLDTALEDSSGHDIDHHYTEANRAQYKAAASLSIGIDEIESLVDFIRESLLDLDATISAIAELHDLIQSKLYFCEKRSQCFKRTLQHKEAELDRKLKSVHEIVIFRNGRHTRDTNPALQLMGSNPAVAENALIVLVLIYLPAIFVSTLFSTPLFSFNPPKSGSMLSSQFWIYWAVSLPLIGLTLILYLLSYWYSQATSKDQGAEGYNHQNQRSTKSGRRVRLSKESLRDQAVTVQTSLDNNIDRVVKGDVDSRQKLQRDEEALSLRVKPKGPRLWRRVQGKGFGEKGGGQTSSNSLADHTQVAA